MVRKVSQPFTFTVFSASTAAHRPQSRGESIRRTSDVVPRCSEKSEAKIRSGLCGKADRMTVRILRILWGERDQYHVAVSHQRFQQLLAQDRRFSRHLLSMCEGNVHLGQVVDRACDARSTACWHVRSRSNVDAVHSRRCGARAVSHRAIPKLPSPESAFPFGSSGFETAATCPLCDKS